MDAGGAGQAPGAAGGAAPDPGWPEGLEFEDDFLEDPVLDPPPEAFADDLGLSPEVVREMRAERDAARAGADAVTAAWRDGTLEDEDEIPGLIDAAFDTRGNLATMTDAAVITVAVKTQEAASRLAARRYAAEAELMRRRPPRYWDRQREKTLRRRDEQDGVLEDPGAPAPPGPVLAPTRELVQELMLALNWTQYRADMDTTRAAALITRMPAAFTMLRDGRTDDEHVRTLEEALRDLSDEDAAKVDAELSPEMGTMTTQDVREAARRTVIRLDPDAAERRRKRNEKKARAVTWANDDHTGTFALDRIPAADAAAMKARVNAIARAAKTAGSTDPLPLLEAKTGVGLILGTLPYIPPPAGNHDDGDGGNGDGGGHDGGDGGSSDRNGGADPGGGHGPDGRGLAGPGSGDSCGGQPRGAQPDGDRPARDLPDEDQPGRPADERPDESPADGGGPGWTAWPPVPGTSGAAEPGCVTLPPGLRPAKPGRIRLLAPWRTLAGLAGEPGELTWFGVITPGQARELAAAAATDRTARWQVIVTDDTGHAREIAGLRDRLDTAAGGCAHTRETDRYTITGKLRRWITIRDRTCRNPLCRRRATQCDLDHTVPYDKGGRSCGCDLGAECRVHHQLKQLPSWNLRQDPGGTFTWTTPAGLTYKKEPHRYPV